MQGTVFLLQNRLDESLNLFQAIVNNRFFVEAAMVNIIWCSMLHYS